MSILNDPHDFNKIKKYVCKVIMSNEAWEPSFVPLPKRNACIVGNKTRNRKEFMFSLELGGFEKDVILDLVESMNIFCKKTWELMGKPKLVWSPIQIRLANH